MARVLHVLDSVTAARALLARRTDLREAEVLSTHYSVVGFLGQHGVMCRDFTDFIGVEATGAAMRQAASNLEERLMQLDQTVGASACEKAGLPRLALFRACFKYLGQYNLGGCSELERVLAERLSSCGAEVVEFYYAVATSVDPVFSCVAAARRACEARNVAFHAIAVAASLRTRCINAVRVSARRALRAAQMATGSIRRLSTPVRGASAGDRTVLLFDPSSDSFFAAALAVKGVRLLHMDRNGSVADAAESGPAADTTAKRMQTVLQEWLRAQPAVAANEIERSCVAFVVRNASSLLRPLALAHHWLQAAPISAAAWDVPLITRQVLNLIAELFLNSGVAVLGRQHGANYVDQRLGNVHFDSDFNRCTHYFSYGFAPREFAIAYPGAKPRCSFTPAGNPPRPLAGRRKPVDVAFPIMNSVPLFYLARVPECELVRRQRGILEAMEGRTDLTCVVKPPPGYAPDNFAHCETLAALRHVRIERGTWSSFLMRMQPRLVVFESASTPLFEALPLDVDIFLMLDPLFPFTEPAFALLEKRAHVFETIERLAAAIRRYGSEPIERRRNPAYYETYVNRGSKEVVAEVLARVGRPADLAGQSPAEECGLQRRS